MRISDLGEFGLIEKIRKSAARASSSVLIGIGDDAAAVTFSPSAAVLSTSDMLLEDVHFDLAFTDYYSLGWKSAAVNLSDIAAMGGIPRFCLVSLGIPTDLSVEQITEFYRGCNALLRKHRAALVGGDTCSSRQALVISITLLGECKRSRLVSRAGARAGDRIFVTGTLGDSAAGLELLKAGAGGRGQGTGNKDFKSAIRNPQSAVAALVKRHLRPVPRVEWGRKIAQAGCASAMIDISDGLSSDLSHICTQSGVGARINAGTIPLSSSIRRMSARLGKSPLQYALSGGEDYELLFASPPGKVGKLKRLGFPVTEIGEITAGRRVFLVGGGGEKSPLVPSGFDHFARS